VDVLEDEIFSTVTGRFLVDDDPAGSVPVILNVPSNGTLTQVFDVTDSNGEFQFDNVSFGFRSLSVNPRLAYEQNSAAINGSDSLRFTITNYGTSPVTITSIVASYNVAAWFQRIRVGSTTVFDYQDPPHNGMRAGSGQLVTFSSGVAVAGSGRPAQVFPVRVDQSVTVTPDLALKGVGSSVLIRIENFRNAPSGAGSSVNPTGATFVVTFSDGSQVTVPAP
jgi:hypothetical protein